MELFFKDQIELQRKLNVVSPLTVGQLSSDIKEMNFFLNQEVVELVEEIAGTRTINKPWKSSYSEVSEQPIVITDAVRSEAIDVLKFAMNICIMAGITADNVEEEFYKVHDKNIRRIKDGY